MTRRKVDGRVSVVVSVPGRSDDSSLRAHFPNEQSEQLPILPERDKSELPVSLISFAKMCGYLRGWLSWDSTRNCQHVSLWPTVEILELYPFCRVDYGFLRAASGNKCMCASSVFHFLPTNDVKIPHRWITSVVETI